MVSAILAGVAAGYGIAIPVGAISLLIVETGLRRGFRLAAAAGAGAASADGAYATIAAAFGTALAGLLAPYARPLRLVAVVVLVAIAVRGLLAVRRGARAQPGGPAGIPADVEAAERGGSTARTYAAFLGLTMLNPLTITYFGALILGLAATGAGPVEKAAFAAAAFLASLSWQLLLATVAAVAHRRLSPRLRAVVVVVGNAIILAFAAAVAINLAA